MRQWTTPINTFDTDIDLTDAEVIFITYEQGGTTVLEKTIDDVTVTENAVSVKLTQEETGMFDDSLKVKMQIRAKFPDGTAVASNKMETCVGEVLKTGEI